jgi:hypothetical protein
MSQVEKIERVHVTYDKKKKRKNEAYIAKLHMTFVFFFFFFALCEMLVSDKQVCTPICYRNRQ